MDAMTIAQVMSLAVMLVLGLASLAWGIFSWRRSGSKIEIELGFGEVDEEGLLSVYFASGEENIIQLPKSPQPNGDVIGKRSKRKSKKSAPRSKKPKPGVDAFSLPDRGPVNVIFIHNKGPSSITASRCHYKSNFFIFEAQPGASQWGHHLPKKLDVGEDAILVHDYEMMKAFLNKVMYDQRVEIGIFVVVLTLGNGSKVKAKTRMSIHASMGEEELAKLEPMIFRREIELPNVLIRRTIFGRQQFMHNVRPLSTDDVVGDKSDGESSGE